MIFPVTSYPAGTTVAPEASRIGEFRVARKLSPGWFLPESTLSSRRTAMLVPAGIVIGLGDGGDTGAAVLAVGFVLAGAAEAVIVAGFGVGELAAAGAWDVVDAVWVEVEAGITGAGGGCGAPTGDEGGAT
jgi:hypothetical protein